MLYVENKWKISFDETKKWESRWILRQIIQKIAHVESKCPNKETSTWITHIEQVQSVQWKLLLSYTIFVQMIKWSRLLNTQWTGLICAWNSISIFTHILILNVYRAPWDFPICCKTGREGVGGHPSRSTLHGPWISLKTLKALRTPIAETPIPIPLGCPPPSPGFFSLPIPPVSVPSENVFSGGIFFASQQTRRTTFAFVGPLVRAVATPWERPWPQMLAGMPPPATTHPHASTCIHMHSHASPACWVLPSPAARASSFVWLHVCRVSSSGSRSLRPRVSPTVLSHVTLVSASVVVHLLPLVPCIPLVPCVPSSLHPCVPAL